MKHQTNNNPNSIFLFFAKGLALIIITGSVILYSDRKGYFEADNSNNHTLRKWNAYYELTQKHKIDIVLVGNSHLYTGINPKNLSEALGMTSFILASPGTHIADSYYCLEEAIRRCTPQIAIVETYGIGKINIDSMKGSSLSDQIKSFAARKDSYLKLLSTPSLFNSDFWGYAWSTTIRNHNFLLTNQEQIKRNMLPTPQRPQRLYLGRYVRWTSGIEDSTLLKYKKIGAPVDGQQYSWNETTEFYVKKIADLCEKNQIKLIFLTLPMFHEHIKNYNQWKSTLAELLQPYSDKWLDLQAPYDYTLLGPECFENSYAQNQHITYYGSLICSYKLAAYIENKYGSQLKRQDHSPQWHQLFYGDEGYFENYSPHPQDKNNFIIARNILMDSIVIHEIDLLKNKNQQSLFVKISNKKKIPGILNSNLQMIARIKLKGEENTIAIEIPYDKGHISPKHHLYSVSLRPDLDILEIINMKMI